MPFENSSGPYFLEISVCATAPLQEHSALEKTLFSFHQHSAMEDRERPWELVKTHETATSCDKESCSSGFSPLSKTTFSCRKCFLEIPTDYIDQGFLIVSWLLQSTEAQPLLTKAVSTLPGYVAFFHMFANFIFHIIINLPYTDARFIS